MSITFEVLEPDRLPGHRAGTMLPNPFFDFFTFVAVATWGQDRVPKKLLGDRALVVL